MICTHCERKAKASKQDPAFCHDCYDRIEQRMRNPMPRVRAAVAYLNCSEVRDSNANEERKLIAFLSIFHPEIPLAKVRQLSRKEKS